MIRWLVQDVGIHMANIEQNFQTLQRMNLPFGNFGVIEYKKEITNLENILFEPNEHFIVRGGTKMLKILEGVKSISEINAFLSPEQIKDGDIYLQRLKEGIFYHEQKFDQAYYGSLDLPLLNNDAQLFPIKENLNQTFDKDVFIKPSKDQKAFNAGILEAGNSIKDFIFSQRYQLSYIEEMAVVAPCKKILSEYRFFVVDKEVVTGSRYRFLDKTNLSEVIPPEMQDAAREYAKLYQPHDVFTMDLAQTPEGISIVEYNCWNASGLYKTNIPKIFDAVHQYKEQKIQNKKVKFSF